MVYFAKGKYDLKVLEKDKSKKYTDWETHQRQIKDVKQNYDVKNNDRADSKPNDCKLIEMQGYKNEKERSMSPVGTTESEDASNSSTYYDETDGQTSHASSSSFRGDDSSDSDAQSKANIKGLQMDGLSVNVDVNLAGLHII